MSEKSCIWMGINLGYIQEITLVDGTILENTAVLYCAPIPSKEHAEKVFNSLNTISSNIFQPATPEWSKYPELMRNSPLFKSQIHQS